MEMLKYIRNPSLIQSQDKKAEIEKGRYEEMSNLLGFGLTKRADRLYIPSSRRVLNYTKQK